jgi:hypothetical protein
MARTTRARAHEAARRAGGHRKVGSCRPVSSHSSHVFAPCPRRVPRMSMPAAQRWPLGADGRRSWPAPRRALHRLVPTAYRLLLPHLRHRLAPGPWRVPRGAERRPARGDRAATGPVCSGRALQEGGARADHRRGTGWAARLRYRGLAGGGADQGPPLARGRSGRHPCGAGSGVREPAGEAAEVPGGRGTGRHRTRRACPHRADQSARQRAGTPGRVCARRPGDPSMTHQRRHR